MALVRICGGVLLCAVVFGLLGCEKQIREVRAHERSLTPAPHTAPRPGSAA
jgi:hypothetical protein